MNSLPILNKNQFYSFAKAHFIVDYLYDSLPHFLLTFFIIHLSRTQQIWSACSGSGPMHSAGDTMDAGEEWQLPTRRAIGCSGRQGAP